MDDLPKPCSFAPESGIFFHSSRTHVIKPNGSDNPHQVSNSKYKTTVQDLTKKWK